jgi:hypothetical protein
VRLKPGFTEARDNLRAAEASLPRVKDTR